MKSLPPMIQNRMPLLALAVISMAVVGWNLGGNSGERSAVDPPPAHSRPSRPERPPRTRLGPSGEAAQRLEAIRATANPSERMRATIALANSLPSAGFAAWLDGAWFTLRGGMESTVFTQILMERWRLEDPEGLLLWGLKNDSSDADAMLSTWAKTEPQRVLDFFKSHPNDAKELNVLDDIAAKNPELALRRLQEMAAAGISQVDAYYARTLLNDLSKQSPAALEAALDSLPGSLRLHAETYLIRGKMQNSFASELRKLWDRPDGMNVFESIIGETPSLSRELVTELANLPASWRAQIASASSNFFDTADAAEWAAADLVGAGFTAEQAKAIRIRAVSRLESSEPEIAFKILEGLDLPPDRKQSMLASIFAYLKDKPEKAEALLAQLGSDADRQVARNAFQPPPSSPEPQIKKIEQPVEWLATVTALDFTKENPSGIVRMIEDWEPEKLAALAAGFSALPDSKKRKLSRDLLESGMYGLGGPLLGEVIACFVAHPSEEPVSGDPFAHPNQADTSAANQLAIDYAVDLAEKNPGKAGVWIGGLPEGEAKWYAAKNLQNIWSLYDPEAAERWLKTLPSATREKVKSLQ